MSITKAWLQLGRVSNLPTVWSNVLHGLGVALFVAYVLPIDREFGRVPPFAWSDLGRMLNQGFMLIIGMSLLYTGGMVLNDVCDRKIDFEQRPHRPIPSGRVAWSTALVAAALLLLLGWACMLVYRPRVAAWAGVLVATIVAYNFLHRYRLVGLVLMASCRGLVVWTAASAMEFGVEIESNLIRVLGSALAVACYTAVITLIAWGEALPSFPKLAKWVGVMIALMPVLDAGFLWLFGMWPMAVFCVGCAGLSLLAQRYVAGS